VGRIHNPRKVWAGVFSRDILYQDVANERGLADGVGTDEKHHGGSIELAIGQLIRGGGRGGQSQRREEKEASVKSIVLIVARHGPSTVLL
jgi:hypothetical protein